MYIGRFCPVFERIQTLQPFPEIDRTFRPIVEKLRLGYQFSFQCFPGKALWEIDCLGKIFSHHLRTLSEKVLAFRQNKFVRAAFNVSIGTFWQMKLFNEKNVFFINFGPWGEKVRLSDKNVVAVSSKLLSACPWELFGERDLPLENLNFSTNVEHWA